ncbi:MAG: hypothetical protein LKE40_08090 [Spirochaetia bacterium]|jgi:transposase-like protein|nr:hypothetical protein [Spirochaetia bacterium]
MSIIKSKSRRETPWSGDGNASALQQFIDESNQANYERRHPSEIGATEAGFINSFIPDGCPWCGSSQYISFGKTRTRIRRYRCRQCGRTSTPITGTIFDSRKIPLSQWLDFLLSLFGYGSFRMVSKSNRNAYSTTMYWLHKVFLVLRGIQDDIVLDCKEVQLDETCFKVRKPDVRKKPNGKEYAGLSRNQICIGIAYDGVRMVAFEEGTGKPAKTKTYGLFRRHIPRGTLIVHDMEHARDKLVRELGLTSRTYSSKEMKKLPEDKFKKVEILMNRAMHFRERLKFRDGFRK